mmetsp:Transcript_8050/g.17529  ORF Transcript_8050/g.17529 Transcript_8050/m.17529 type:complete len:209 (+) Transcript_8050:355-981(+)
MQWPSGHRRAPQLSCSTACLTEAAADLSSRRTSRASSTMSTAVPTLIDWPGPQSCDLWSWDAARKVGAAAELGSRDRPRISADPLTLALVEPPASEFPEGAQVETDGALGPLLAPRQEALVRARLASSTVRHVRSRPTAWGGATKEPDTVVPTVATPAGRCIMGTAETEALRLGPRQCRTSGLGLCTRCPAGCRAALPGPLRAGLVPG